MVSLFTFSTYSNYQNAVTQYGNQTIRNYFANKALHNATGLTDFQLQTALQSFGLKPGASSQNISALMEKDCVF